MTHQIFEHGGKSEQLLAAELLPYSDDMVREWRDGQYAVVCAWIDNPNVAHQWTRSLFRYTRELERRAVEVGS